MGSIPAIPGTQNVSSLLSLLCHERFNEASLPAYFKYCFVGESCSFKFGGVFIRAMFSIFALYVYIYTHILFVHCLHIDQINAMMQIQVVYVTQNAYSAILHVIINIKKIFLKVWVVQRG